MYLGHWVGLKLYTSSHFSFLLFYLRLFLLKKHPHIQVYGSHSLLYFRGMASVICLKFELFALNGRLQSKRLFLTFIFVPSWNSFISSRRIFLCLLSSLFEFAFFIVLIHNFPAGSEKEIRAGNLHYICKLLKLRSSICMFVIN